MPTNIFHHVAVRVLCQGGETITTDIARPQHFVVTLGDLMIFTFAQLIVQVLTWHLP